MLRPLSLYLLILLVGCSTGYPTVAKDVNLIATVNIKDKTVSFIDADKEKMFAEWEMKEPYTGGLIFPDNDTLLLYGKQVDTVDLFSLSKGKKVDSWKTGAGIVSGKLVCDNKVIAFADQSRHQTRFFTIKGEEIIHLQTGRNPISLLEDEKEKKLYVISFDEGRLTVVDLPDKRVETNFTINKNVTGALLQEKERELWIGGHGQGEEIEQYIHVYDLVTGTLKKKISAPSMPVNFLKKDKFIYTLSHGTSLIYKMNSDGKQLDNAQVGVNPFEMVTMDDILYVAGYDSNDVNLVNLDNLSIINTIPVGKGPFKIITREID